MEIAHGCARLTCSSKVCAADGRPPKTQLQVRGQPATIDKETWEIKPRTLHNVWKTRSTATSTAAPAASPMAGPTPAEAVTSQGLRSAGTNPRPEKPEEDTNDQTNKKRKSENQDLGLRAEVEAIRAENAALKKQLEDLLAMLQAQIPNLAAPGTRQC